MLISIVIPAFQEQDDIGECLAALVQQDVLRVHPGEVEAIVVANGCTDNTVASARAWIKPAACAGLRLVVLDITKASKAAALNEGDRYCSGAFRVYLDADVGCEKNLLGQLASILNSDEPRYGSGTLKIRQPRSRISQAYGRVWASLPFVHEGTSGCGLYAVNAAGRLRWGDFPPIHSDDKFARLQFLPKERFRVTAKYFWPLPEGFVRLVRVRRRWCEGNAELLRTYPELAPLDDSGNSIMNSIFVLLFRSPLDLIMFTIVYASARVLAFTTRNRHVVLWRR